MSWALLAAGRFDEARESFEQLVATNPRDGQALAGLAECATEDARLDDAIAFARRAIRCGEVRGHVALASAHFEARRYRAVLDTRAAAERASLTPEQHARLLTLCALSLLELRDDDALVMARRAVALDVRSAQAWAALSLALLKDDRCQDAMRPIERALELEPANAELVEQRDEVAKAIARSETILRQVTERPARDLIAFHNLAASYYSLGRYSEALEASDRAIALPEEDDGFHWNLRSKILDELGDREGAAAARGRSNQLWRASQRGERVAARLARSRTTEAKASAKAKKASSKAKAKEAARTKARR